jgi:hypothetical protein
MCGRAIGNRPCRSAIAASVFNRSRVDRASRSVRVLVSISKSEGR